MQTHVSKGIVLSAFVRSSLSVAALALALAPALAGCSAADGGESGEQVGKVEEAFTATAGTISGVTSFESAVVSRGTGLVDVFARAGNNRLMMHSFNGHNALPVVDLGGPPGVNMGSVAVTVNGGRLDVFVSASNGGVYHKFSNFTTGVPTWSDWYQVPGVTVKSPLSVNAITVSSWGPGRLDLFYITPSGKLGHKWGENYVWSAGVETGDDWWAWYLVPPNSIVYSPPLESIATKPGYIDIVLGKQGTSSGLKHHGYHNGWIAPVNVPCCEIENTIFEITDFALAKFDSGSNSSFSVYVKHSIVGSGYRLEELAYQGSWWIPVSHIRPFDRSNSLALANVNLNDAVKHGSTSKVVTGAHAGTTSGWWAQF